MATKIQSPLLSRKHGEQSSRYFFGRAKWGIKIWNKNEKILRPPCIIILKICAGVEELPKCFRRQLWYFGAPRDWNICGRDFIISIAELCLLPLMSIWSLFDTTVIFFLSRNTLHTDLSSVDRLVCRYSATRVLSICYCKQVDMLKNKKCSYFDCF